MQFVDKVAAEAHKITDLTSARMDIDAFNHLRHQILPEFLETTTSDEVAFACYFFISLFDDIAYNLSIDFPYKESCGEEVHGLKKEFFQKVGKAVLTIAEACERSDDRTIHLQMKNTVTEYLSLVANINRIFEANGNA